MCLLVGSPFPDSPLGDSEHRSPIAVLVVILAIARVVIITPRRRDLPEYQNSSKGGAVETGCSGLHYILGCFTM